MAKIVVAVPPAARNSVEPPERTGSRGRPRIGSPPGIPDQAANAEAWDGAAIVAGGATRAESVANALAAVETELVAIHDAARPLLTPELLEGVAATLLADDGAQGAIAAAPVADTLKRADAPPANSRSTLTPLRGVNVDRIAETVDRDGLWAAQTPQVFRAAALREALAAAGERAVEATDEAMLVEWAGGRVLLHPSPGPNPKLTAPADLRLIEALLAAGAGSAPDPGA